MALVALKSGVLTKRDANPIQFSAPGNSGILHEKVGTLESSAADDIGSTYRMVTIPSTARVSQVLLYCDDMGTAGAADVGLYRTTKDGGAVVDADFFASAVDMNAAALNGSDVTHESGVFNIDDAEKTVWEALGLAADPQLMYDIVLTLTAATQSAGTVTVKARYSY